MNKILTRTPCLVEFLTCRPVPVGLGWVQQPMHDPRNYRESFMSIGANSSHAQTITLPVVVIYEDALHVWLFSTPMASQD
uniref:Uncharacterized protein n=1 Tax=Rhizophora mucronata TaxID=61149 RepID=A0A2P2P4H3_RHIMU